MIAPIETKYKGYRFRSRLEARWAVFLTAAGIPWNFESQGFHVGGANYLPDFWLPNHEVFIEIKPGSDLTQWKNLDRFLAERKVCQDLQEASGFPVVMLRGDCWPCEYEMFGPNWDDDQEFAEDRGRQLVKCRKCDGLCWEIESSGFGDFGTHSCGDHDRWPIAFSAEFWGAARSARFEFGESP